MNAADVQRAMIRHIKAHVGTPVIQADQGGEIPEGPHIVFKIIVPYAKDAGRPEIRSETTAEEYRRIQAEQYRLTFSFTAVSEDADTSIELAQAARDWFDFHGYDELDAAGVVVISLGDVGNRDSVNDDESRAGFDAILRASREMVKVAQYIEAAEITNE